MATAIRIITTPSSLQRRNPISSSSVDPGNLDLPLLKSKSSGFLTANGHTCPFPTSHLEMVSLRPLTYTSLKDLLPSSSPGIHSPTFAGNQSWHEIPIKNRLVQQAAWAYLQPMLTSPEIESQGFFRRLKLNCHCECLRNPSDGCLGFINLKIAPLVKRAIGRVFGVIPGKRNGNDDGEGHDDF